VYACVLRDDGVADGNQPGGPVVTAEFDVSNTVIGFALTGLWASYFLTQYPSGVFADRFGERSVILVSIGGTAVASLAIATSPSIAVFVGAIPSWA